MICVDLAFTSEDHEVIEVYQDDDLKEKINKICLKRSIVEEQLKSKILEIV